MKSIVRSQPSLALRRATGLATAAAVALGSVLLAPTGSAFAATSDAAPVTGTAVTVNGGTFTWKVSNYVASWLPGGTPGTQGSTSQSGNVTFGSAGWTFTGGTGSTNAAGVTTIAFDATVDLRPYSGFGQPAIQILIDDPILTVDADGSGALVATLSSVGSAGATPVVTATLADFAAGTLTPGANGALAYDTVPAYAGTVPAGTFSAGRTDAFPVSFVNGLDTSLRAFFHATGSGRDGEKVAAPITASWKALSVTADPSGALDWKNQTIAVSGSGFAAPGAGVYVAVAPANIKTTNPTDWNVAASLYSDVEWLSPGTGVKPDGTFATSLTVEPVEGVTEYAVFVFAAHGSPNRALDAQSPVFGFTYPFSDSSRSEFSFDIAWLYRTGLSTGTAVDGQLPVFQPDENVSRQATAAFFYRLENPGVAGGACTGTAPFSDVPASARFCTEVSWSKSTGLLKGYGDGTFRPGNSINRDAFAALAYRWTFDGAAAPACTTKPFIDISVTHQFCGEIAWMGTTGVANGFDDGTFRSATAIDRKAIAAFIHRLVEL